MVRARRKKTGEFQKITIEESYNTHRRSSMKVNLSYMSSVSDCSNNYPTKKTISERSESELTIQKNFSPASTKFNSTQKSNIYDITTTPSNPAHVTVINLRESTACGDKVTKEISSTLSIIEKEEQLNKSCEKLKNAIVSKTKEIFEKDNELTKKTAEVFETVNYLNLNQPYEEQSLRSPSIKINIGKNDQIVMSGNGKEKNPVQVNSMHKHTSENDWGSQSTNENDNECKSIGSTPKISTIKKNKLHKNVEKVLKVPVARLFVDDPNNSLSEIQPVPTVVNNYDKNIVSKNEIEKTDVNISERSNELNFVTSPILSQGYRKARISRLSLKKKILNTQTKTDKTNESFFERKPLICSSYIEKQDKVENKNESNISDKNLNLKKKSKSNFINSNKTISLDGKTKTIELDNTTDQSSCIMDITTISSNMPIVRRSFQHIIRRSLNFNDITSTQSTAQVTNKSISREQCKIPGNNEKVPSLTVPENQNKESQENCSASTDYTSLNVNTSLDRINSDDLSGQKENKKPNNTTKTSVNSKNIESEENTLVLRQSSNTDSSKNENSSMIIEENDKTLRSRKKNKSLVTETSIHPSKKQKNGDTSLPSISTARSSLQVNTSLDSVEKYCGKKNTLEFNNLLPFIKENSDNKNQSEKNQSTIEENESENVSLKDRIKNLSKKSKAASPKISKDKNLSIAKTNEIEFDDPKDNSEDKIINTRSKKPVIIENKKVNMLKKSDFMRKNKSINSSSTSESSIVETTPFPASRSFLLKTMIKNSIAANTLNPRKFVDFTDEEDFLHQSLNNAEKNERKRTTSESSSDTVILNSSDESDKEKEGVIIEESLNNTTGNDKGKDKKLPVKRKLYPLRENSQISFSSIDFSPNLESEKQAEKKSEVPVQNKKRKNIKKKKKEIRNDDPVIVSESERAENEVILKKIDKIPRKPRKIISKKIIVKKMNKTRVLDDLIENNGKIRSQLSNNNRNSLNEFDFRKKKVCGTKTSKRHKIVIVMTGLSNEDKNMVKTVIKTLGSAVLELNVTPRTTHVISSGTRTINLLKGIIRGCWLLSMEWVLKSLESKQWLEPCPYEMVHFSKAVQENRRDRQLFGKAYVPDLFVTCGFIYVENGTSPPASVLKELVKAAGGRITENINQAEIEIGRDGLKEIWILDSITTGEIQPLDDYKRS